MTTMSYHKPIGGVEFCELHFADSLASISFEDEECCLEFMDDGIAVTLADDLSSFVERLDCDRGVAKVEHRLRLVAQRNEADEWLDRNFMRRAAHAGIIALLTLNDGRTLAVGVSQHLGTEQPLRLGSLTCDSGVAPADTPRVILELHSTDTALATPFF